jgi:hypothetical protein
MSLLHGNVLSCGVQIAHPPLQRRTIVERAATAQCETGVGDTHARGVDPYRALETPSEYGLIS